jgi:hypothetical protein
MVLGILLVCVAFLSTFLKTKTADGLKNAIHWSVEAITRRTASFVWALTLSCSTFEIGSTIGRNPSLASLSRSRSAPA